MRDRLWKWCGFWCFCCCWYFSVWFMYSDLWIVDLGCLGLFGLLFFGSPKKMKQGVWSESGDSLTCLYNDDFWYLWTLGRFHVFFFENVGWNLFFFCNQKNEDELKLRGNHIGQLQGKRFTATGNTPPKHWWVGFDDPFGWLDPPWWATILLGGGYGSIYNPLQLRGTYSLYIDYFIYVHIYLQIIQRTVIIDLI